MTQFNGSTIRLVAQLASSLDLAQMPFCQRKEVRRAHLRVIAEPEQRFSVSFANIVAQSALEHFARGLQISEQERDKTENSTSDAGLRGAPFGFSFAKKGLGFRMRLAMFATHEARQTLAVIGDKARSSFIRRSGELASARVGLRSFRRRQNLSATSPRVHSPYAASGAARKAPDLAPRVRAFLVALRRRARSLCRDAPIASLKAERRSASSPALPHHSIAEIVGAGCSEMMSDRLRFRSSRDQRRRGASDAAPDGGFSSRLS